MHITNDRKLRRVSTALHQEGSPTYIGDVRLESFTGIEIAFFILEGKACLRYRHVCICVRLVRNFAYKKYDSNGIRLKLIRSLPFVYNTTEQGREHLRW
jgi:hypothetical protein